MIPPFEEYLIKRELIEWEKQLFTIETSVKGVEIEAQAVALDKGMPAAYQFLIDVYLKGTDKHPPLYGQVLDFYQKLLKRVAEFESKGRGDLVEKYIQLLRKYEDVIRTVNKTMEEKVKPAYETFVLEPLRKKLEEAKKNYEQLQQQLQQAEKVYKDIRPIKGVEEVMKEILN